MSEITSQYAIYDHPSGFPDPLNCQHEQFCAIWPSPNRSRLSAQKRKGDDMKFGAPGRVDDRRRAPVPPSSGRRIKNRASREIRLTRISFRVYKRARFTCPNEEHPKTKRTSSNVVAQFSSAFALAERFEFYYTPKSASCLNMIEIEF